MAGPSPSPSGSSRRLSELLEEQQEPFSLHLYLLEKGCSLTTLDAAGGCGVASLPCWPRSRGTSPATRRVTASKRTPATASGLLSKFLHGTAAPESTKRKKKLRSAAIGPCSVGGEKAACKIKNAVEAHGAEAANDEGESYGDDDSSKQLSPVSVLERRTFDKPPRAYAEKAIVVLRELLNAARRPALLQRKVAIESNKSDDVLMETSTTTTTPAPAPALAPTRTDRATSVAHLEEMFEAKGHDLVPLDMAGEREDARLGRWDVGAELAVAVLEALTEEVVVELMVMGMVHHEDANAIDVKQCWLLPNC